MKLDTQEIARKCVEYQKHANIQRVPSSELTTLHTAIPFGTFSQASKGRKYAFVAVEYFTKWAEAEPIRTITQESTVKFVFRNIICKFGVPVQIITDNGTQFARKVMRNFCKDSNIKLSFASIHHPQTNGQVEAANKSIIKILKRKVGEDLKTWADTMPEVLGAYRTTHKTATGQTPYKLAFGLEAVAPTELVWPTARIRGYEPNNNEAAMVINRKTWKKLGKKLA